ncbi:MAG: type I phosphomannose isomerase catalytic subunit [Tepidisphaeraceae bacterium]
MLYPMIFQPRYVEKIWGGQKLQSILGKGIPAGKSIGESWELFDFPPGVIEGSTGWTSAALTNGPLAGKTLHQLVEEFGRSLHGDVKLVGEHKQFPILIKFLDAREDLSVQVHPPQSYADTHPGAHLKNEAWYVFQHDAGSRILKGLKPGVTRAALEQSINDGTCESLIKAIPVKDGECYYLPSGTIHALGAGCFVAEVQTPSDTTYRVFDFNRVEESTGKPRALHVKQAMDCIDFSGQEPAAAPRQHTASFFTTVTRLAEAPQFTIEKVRMAEGVEQAIPYTQPVVWILLSGEASLWVDDLKEPTRVTTGTTVLLPAAMKNPRVVATTDVSWLEVTFPIAG